MSRYFYHYSVATYDSAIFAFSATEGWSKMEKIVVKKFEISKKGRPRKKSFLIAAIKVWRAL